MLRDNSEMVTKSLDSARPQVGLEEKLSQARVLAESVTTSLGRLSPSFGNQQEISRTKAELETLFNQAMDLEKSLQP
jgi:hypothetical protein